MGETHTMHESVKNAYEILDGKHDEYHYGYLVVDGRIILKCTQHIRVLAVRLYSTGSG